MVFTLLIAALIGILGAILLTSWLLMLFLGNIGVSISLLGAIPGGILLDYLAIGVVQPSSKG